MAEKKKKNDKKEEDTHETDKIDTLESLGTGLYILKETLEENPSPTNEILEQIQEQTVNLANQIGEIEKPTAENSAALGKIQEGLSEIGEKLKDIPDGSGIVDDIQSKLNGINEKIDSAGDTIENAIGEDKIDAASDIAETTVDAGKDVASDIGNDIKTSIETEVENNSAMQQIGDAGTMIADGLKTAVDTVANVIPDSVNTDIIVDSINKFGTIAAPIMACTGIGLPIAIAMVAIMKMHQMNKGSKRLLALLDRLFIVLANATMLHKLILRTIVEFLNLENSEDHALQGQETIIEEMKKSTINPIIIDNIISSIERVYGIIQLVAPQDSKKFGSTLGKISRMATRMTASKYYMNELARETTFLNSFFILYNAQFEFVKSRYERLIVSQYKSTNSPESNVESNDESNVHPYYRIWQKIESSKEYTEFLMNRGKFDDKLRNRIIEDMNAVENAVEATAKQSFHKKVENKAAETEAEATANEKANEIENSSGRTVKTTGGKGRNRKHSNKIGRKSRRRQPSPRLHVIEI